MLEPSADSLPQRLKSATRDGHARAERSGVMAQLLGGTLGLHGYTALLANLHALYRALESALRQWPQRPPLLDTLARSAALEADLRALGAASVLPVPATLDYAARLPAWGAAQAHRLWAHVYVRYLGDLHGGQVLSRRVRGLYAGADAVRFYDFGDDVTVRRLREALRAQLGSLVLSRQQADEVVAEAVWAFDAHCRIFEQIQAAG